jgi:hypothetical protein
LEISDVRNIFTVWFQPETVCQATAAAAWSKRGPPTLATRDALMYANLHAAQPPRLRVNNLVREAARTQARSNCAAGPGVAGPGRAVLLWGGDCGVLRLLSLLGPRRVALAPF